MAHLTMEQLKALVGEGGGHTPAYEQSEHMPTPVFREDIRRKIYSYLCKCDRAVTAGEIARALGKKNSTWFRGRVDQLWRDGVLLKSEYTWHNGMPVYYYEVKR